MHVSILFSLLSLNFLFASCYPGLSELLRRIPQEDDGDANPTMIGDLATTGPTTPVGQSIYNILMGTESAERNTKKIEYIPPGLPGSTKCKADTCCVWWYVSLQLILSFTGITGRCNDRARAAIRLGFHDAGTWSAKLAAQGQDFGGADGSIALSGTEISRAENNGLQDIIGKMLTWQKQYGVGMADLIQFAAAHAVVTCPLGPRIRVFVGRKDSKAAAPDGLLPSATSDADTLIKLFEDKTISPHELAALVGAHSASKQFNFNVSMSGAPQDGTPGVWDVLFYNETVQNTPAKVFRFPSDIVLAADSRMSAEWDKFRRPNGVGQSHWNEVCWLLSIVGFLEYFADDGSRTMQRRIPDSAFLALTILIT